MGDGAASSSSPPDHVDWARASCSCNGNSGDDSVSCCTPGVGLRYRRSAGSGTPLKPFGRISLAKRDESRERVSISSAGMLGAVKLEKDFAADLSALSEAVRFDLKVDFGLIVRSWRGVMSEIMVVTESAGELGRRGWSSHSSIGGDDTNFSLLWVSPADFLLTKEGREGALIVDMVLFAASSDGVDAMESLDTDLDDMKPGSFSSSISCRLASSLSPSSAGSSSMSSGPLPSEDAGVPSRLHSCTNSSIDMRLCRDVRRCRDLGGGMAVTARSAATAGGSASGLWAESARRAFLPPC
jgi:hypothetical protein